MTAATPELVRPLPAVPQNPLGPVLTLARRRFQLSARTPRELIVPLLTPILFALVIAPALKDALHTSAAYEAYVATGTIGLLIPLNTMFAGIGVLVDRESGAQRELLTAPISRALLVFANLAVAYAITALQIAVLLGFARARGIHFDVTATGLLWFLVAGSLFPISALPAFLTWLARFLPLTHALALVRYGLLHDPSGLHGIWQMHSTTAMASLSLAVVAAFALLLAAVGVRTFSHRAVQ